MLLAIGLTLPAARLVEIVPAAAASGPHPPCARIPVANRRYILRAAGVSLALSLFESLTNRVLGAGLAVGSKAGEEVGVLCPIRIVCMGNMLGFSRPEFFPKQIGRAYESPTSLQPMAPPRCRLW